MAASPDTFSCSLKTDKTTYKPGEPVELTFELKNIGELDLYILDWHTPLEGLYNRYLQVFCNGNELRYQGIMAKRGNPSADSYVLVKAGESVSGVVDLSKAYSTKTTGMYEVKSKIKLWDVKAREEGVELEPSALGSMKSVPLSCNPVEFLIE